MAACTWLRLDRGSEQAVCDPQHVSRREVFEGAFPELREPVAAEEAFLLLHGRGAVVLRAVDLR